jgi:polysaccharide export outer membrane protein
MRTISLIPAREDEDGSTGLNLNIDDIEVQPDGTIVLPLLQPIRAVGLTIEELRRNVNKAYSKFYKQDPVWILPVKVNTRLQDLRDSVDARGGQGGQRINARVSPDGTLQLPLLRTPVPAQGLTFAELKQEIDARYRDIVDGIEVTPVLSARAPRFVYVVGEVRQPGQIVLNQPTSVMMAISQAGGFNGLDANLRQVVVIRRGEDWRMMATILDVQGALYGRRPCPADDIWLRDSDVVVVPKSPLNIANEWIRQVFTRGIYSVVPQGATGIGINFSTSTSL